MRMPTQRSWKMLSRISAEPGQSKRCWFVRRMSNLRWRGAVPRTKIFGREPVGDGAYGCPEQASAYDYIRIRMEWLQLTITAARGVASNLVLSSHYTHGQRGSSHVTGEAGEIC